MANSEYSLSAAWPQLTFQIAALGQLIGRTAEFKYGISCTANGSFISGGKKMIDETKESDHTVQS
jgi:hypothetical protein